MKKKINIEILRDIACFLVIVSHTLGNITNELNGNYNFTWFLAILFYLISRIAVPIFFMISGSLYLKKPQTYKKMITKAIKRILIPMLLISLVIYFKRNPIFTFENLYGFTRKFLNGEILGTYWYLYAIIGLYLATPFLQKMSSKLEEKDYIFMTIFFVVFVSIYGILNYYGIIKITSNLSIPLISMVTYYYLIGNYIFNNEDNLFIKYKKIIFVLTSIFLLMGVIMTYYDIKIGKFVYYFYAGHSSLPVLFTSFSLILIINLFTRKKNVSPKLSSLIVKLGEASFGVYLIHALFLDNLKFIFIFFYDTLGVNLLISNFLYQFILYVGLSLMVYIIRKIPFVNKFV